MHVTRDEILGHFASIVAPGTFKDASKIAQEASKRLPDASKTAKIASKTPPRLPNRLPHAFVAPKISSKTFMTSLQMLPIR